MQINWVEEEWHKIITEVMVRVDNKIETKILSDSLRRKYLEQLSRDFMAEMRKSETWKHVCDRINNMIQPHLDLWRQAYETKARENREYWEEKECELRDRVKTMQEADELTRRLMMCKHLIDNMLPLDQSTSDGKIQAIRSRGLVMAAMMGMTHMGGGSAAVDANEFAKKHR